MKQCHDRIIIKSKRIIKKRGNKKYYFGASAGKEITLYESNNGLIPGIHMIPQTLTGMIPELRIRSNSEHIGYRSQNNFP